MGNINYEIYDEGELVHIYASGNISYIDLIKVVNRVCSEDGCRRDCNAFIDIENAVLEYETKGFKKFSSFFSKLQNYSYSKKWAIYTKLVVENYNHNFKTLENSKNMAVKMFQDRNMALDFLDVSSSRKKTFIAEIG